MIEYISLNCRACLGWKRKLGISCCPLRFLPNLIKVWSIVAIWNHLPLVNDWHIYVLVGGWYHHTYIIALLRIDFFVSFLVMELWQIHSWEESHWQLSVDTWWLQNSSMLRCYSWCESKQRFCSWLNLYRLWREWISHDDCIQYFIIIICTTI